MQIPEDSLRHANSTAAGLAPWAMLCAAAAAELLWSQAAGVTFEGWQSVAATSGLLLLASWLGRTLFRLHRLACMIDALGLYIAFTAAACILTYLCARAGRPFQDAALERIDHAAGFDWLACYRWVAAQPALQTALAAIYASIPLQLLFSCVLLPLGPDRHRARELFWTMSIAASITSVLSGIAPATGAFVRYGLSARATYLHDLLAIRQAAPPAFHVAILQGIVDFPSFHVALAVLFAYAHRSTGPIGWLVAAANALMIASTITEGGHYAIDLPAGAAVAAAAIALTRGLACAWEEGRSGALPLDPAGASRPQTPFQRRPVQGAAPPGLPPTLAETNRLWLERPDHAAFPGL